MTSEIRIVRIDSGEYGVWRTGQGIETMVATIERGERLDKIYPGEFKRGRSEWAVTSHILGYRIHVADTLDDCKRIARSYFGTYGDIKDRDSAVTRQPETVSSDSDPYAFDAQYYGCAACQPGHTRQTLCDACAMESDTESAPNHDSGDSPYQAAFSLETGEICVSDPMPTFETIDNWTANHPEYPDAVAFCMVDLMSRTVVESWPSETGAALAAFTNLPSANYPATYHAGDEIEFGFSAVSADSPRAMADAESAAIRAEASACAIDGCGNPARGDDEKYAGNASPYCDSHVAIFAMRRLSLASLSSILRDEFGLVTEAVCPGCDNAESHCHCCPHCTAENGGIKTPCRVSLDTLETE